MLKEKKILKITEFFYSIHRQKYISLVDKFGLQETTINNTHLAEYDIGIKELFIFNSEGALISSMSFVKNYVKNYNDYILKLRNIVISLFSLSQNNNNNHNRKYQKDGFVYQKIELLGFKLNIMIKNCLVLIGVFNENLPSYYIKMYLLHMYIAFLNFNGDYYETLRSNLEIEKKQSKAISDYNEIEINRENVNGKNNNMFEFTKNDIFQLKIYETYFIKHITLHFDRVFKILIKNEEMYLSYIKFKNMYMIDLTSDSIIFDLLACRKSEKNIKLYKNQKLWQEILYHSKSLLESFKHDHGMNFTTSDSNFRFVKLECTSTYPRLTFIIKFLPILGGLSIVHVYSQKKLSRMTENSDNNVAVKNYKEIDILYGSDIKNNSNIEFRYSEPKKLQEIEKFFIEFYIGLRMGIGIYSDPVHELHYLDYSIISTINDILLNNKLSLNGSKTSIEQILHKINLKLYENFINMQNGQESLPSGNASKTQKDSSGGINPSNLAGAHPPPTRKVMHNQDNENLREKDFLNNKENSNYLKINKLNILKELFNTFEIFNKSEYEFLNSKNANNSCDNDGWIFQQDVKKQLFYKDNHQPKMLDKDINNNAHNESKSELNLNRFNRYNSNLNSVGVRNEREKFEFSDKHNFAKRSTINVAYNAYAGGQPGAGGSNTPGLLDLNKKGTNGSRGYYNTNNNDTIVDMKNRRIGNDMNTIVLSRIDHNETIKYADNNDFSVNSLSLIDKEQDNSDSIIFNKINNHLKNEKSQTIDNLVDELSHDKEKQNFLENKKSSKKHEREKEKSKEETEALNHQKLQIGEAFHKESEKNFDKLLENSKIRKNQLDKIEGKDSKNHIFETDFPEEGDVNKDICYNHYLLAKNDIDLKEVNKMNQKYNKNHKHYDFDYNAIDNGNNTINKFNGNENFVKDNIINHNHFKEQDLDKNNDNINGENFNLNVGIKIRSNIDLNDHCKDNIFVNEYGKNVLNNDESIEKNNKTNELHLNIYAKKQMTLNNPYTYKEENGKFKKFDKIIKLQDKLILKDDNRDLNIKANSQLNLMKIENLTNTKYNNDLNKNKKNNLFEEKNFVDQPLLIKIKGKSIDMQNKKLLDKNDSIDVFSKDNYNSNKKLLEKEKFKENNFLKGNRNNDEINKIMINNKINLEKNKFEDSSGNDFIYQ